MFFCNCSSRKSWSVETNNHRLGVRRYRSCSHARVRFSFYEDRRFQSEQCENQNPVLDKYLHLSHGGFQLRLEAAGSPPPAAASGVSQKTFTFSKKKRKKKMTNMSTVSGQFEEWKLLLLFHAVCIASGRPWVFKCPKNSTWPKMDLWLS